MVDRFGALRLVRVMLLPLIVSLIVLGLTMSRGSGVIFMALSGITVGMIGTVVGAFWAEMYGTRHLGSVRALGTSMMVFSTAAAPVTMGILIDQGVTTNSIALGCAIGATAATLLAIVGLHSTIRSRSGDVD